MLKFDFEDMNSQRGSETKRSHIGPDENQSQGVKDSFSKISDMMSVTTDFKDQTPRQDINFTDKLENDVKSLQNMALDISK